MSEAFDKYSAAWKRWLVSQKSLDAALALLALAQEKRAACWEDVVVLAEQLTEEDRARACEEQFNSPS